MSERRRQSKVEARTIFASLNKCLFWSSNLFTGGRGDHDDAGDGDDEDDCEDEIRDVCPPVRLYKTIIVLLLFVPFLKFLQVPCTTTTSTGPQSS